MITFAGIDGTSSEAGTAELPGEYQNTFKDSFVNRLYRNEVVKFVHPWYLRGPYTDGRDTAYRAECCFNHVKTVWKFNKAKAIFLAGYSRGGAAVIEVAKWLKNEGIPVECLILFDAVDRTYTIGDPNWNYTAIVDTVKHVIFPKRNRYATHSRDSFSNCGDTLQNPSKTKLTTSLFCSTHGGLGGTPWPIATNPYTGQLRDTIWEYGEVRPTTVTPEADGLCSSQTWQWTKAHIINAYMECMERLSLEDDPAIEPKPGGGVKTPESGMPGGGVGGHVPERGHNGREKRYYIVQTGDWLSKIAEKYYGDMMKYKPLHKANISVIGPDPNKIEPRQKLWIPYPDELAKFN